MNLMSSTSNNSKGSKGMSCTTNRTLINNIPILLMSIQDFLNRLRKSYIIKITITNNWTILHTAIIRLVCSTLKMRMRFLLIIRLENQCKANIGEEKRIERLGQPLHVKNYHRWIKFFHSIWNRKSKERIQDII